MSKSVETAIQLCSFCKPMFKMVMFKITQARLQQYMNKEPPDVQVGFRKCRGTRDKLPTLVGL